MKNRGVFVGKDVIELVGNAMYLEPLTIYREYIQNSVDSIDEAVATGVLADHSEGRIDITIDAAARRIKVRDNGAGISPSSFFDKMLAIGGSQKRHTSARGFRGVGRLAGLGFCQELIFRSKAKGEKLCQLKWDIRKMKSALADFQGDGDIADLIESVTSQEISDGETAEEHFFEVELVKPIRLGKDILVNLAKIRSYIGQVAPVPFSPTFSHAEEIQVFLSKHIDYREYNISLNDEIGQVFKPYEDRFQYSDTKYGQLKKIVPFELESVDGENGAIGWLAHHDYQGAIPRNIDISGIRARVGNIQVGERNVFVDAFPEERFNSWSIGEVHVSDRRLVPNGRRDGFEHGVHFANLIGQFLPLANEVAQHCRRESSTRNQLKKVELALLHAESISHMIDQKAVSNSGMEAKVSEAKSKIAEAKKAFVPELFRSSSDVQKKIDELEERFSSDDTEQKNEGPLGRIPEDKREIYSEVFEHIYACSNSQQNARTLIDKILERI